jgi:hypothetical protein
MKFIDTESTSHAFALDFLMEEMLDKFKLKISPSSKNPLVISRRLRDPRYNPNLLLESLTDTQIVDHYIDVLPNLLKVLEFTFKDVMTDNMVEHSIVSSLQNKILYSLEMVLSIPGFKDGYMKFQLSKLIHIIAKDNSVLPKYELNHDNFSSALKYISSIPKRSALASSAYFSLKVAFSILEIQRMYVSSTNLVEESFHENLSYFLRTEWNDKPLVKDDMLSWVFENLIASSKNPEECLEVHAQQIAQTCVSGVSDSDMNAFLSKSTSLFHFKV